MHQRSDGWALVPKRCWQPHRVCVHSKDWIRISFYKLHVWFGNAYGSQKLNKLGWADGKPNLSCLPRAAPLPSLQKASCDLPSSLSPLNTSCRGRETSWAWLTLPVCSSSALKWVRDVPEGSQLGIQFHTNIAQGMDVNSLRAMGFSAGTQFIPGLRTLCLWRCWGRVCVRFKEFPPRWKHQPRELVSSTERKGCPLASSVVMSQQQDTSGLCQGSEHSAEGFEMCWWVLRATALVLEGISCKSQVQSSSHCGF